MRDTVIWINIFEAILSIAWLFSYRLGYYKQWSSDPQITADLTDAYWKLSIVKGVGIGVALVVIAGATLYKPVLVFLGVVFAIVESILTPIYIYPVVKDFYSSAWIYIAWPVIYGVLIAYPHLVLTYELRKGVWGKPNFSE